MKVGDIVKITNPDLREHLFLGKIVHYSPSTGYYSVELERNKPPFRGFYVEDELQKEVLGK